MKSYIILLYLKIRILYIFFEKNNKIEVVCYNGQKNFKTKFMKMFSFKMCGFYSYKFLDIFMQFALPKHVNSRINIILIRNILSLQFK